MNPNEKITLNHFPMMGGEEVKKLLKTVSSVKYSLPKNNEVLIVSLPAQHFEIKLVGENKFDFKHCTERRFLKKEEI